MSNSVATTHGHGVSFLLNQGYRHGYASPTEAINRGCGRDRPNGRKRTGGNAQAADSGIRTGWRGTPHRSVGRERAADRVPGRAEQKIQHHVLRYVSRQRAVVGLDAGEIWMEPANTPQLR